MYKSYRMSTAVGPQMVAGIRYRNEVAAATYFLIKVAVTSTTTLAPRHQSEGQ